VGKFEGLVIAVSADAALKRLPSSAGLIRVTRAGNQGDPRIQSLGAAFPELRLFIPGTEERGSGLIQPFLAVALLLAVTFTMAAGFLLRRDVQRDRRLSVMRSEFVSSVSPELRTPLAAIRMFAENLELDEDLDHGTRREYLGTILQESERLTRLVDNVLDFGKIERGKKTYRFEPARLEEIVERAARTARYPLQEAGFQSRPIPAPRRRGRTSTQPKTIRWIRSVRA
jgi:signal transduction histidine kinase